MTGLGEAIRVLSRLGECGFGFRVRGDRLTIVGTGQPDPELVRGLKACRAAILGAAPALTWRCQCILWPARVYGQYNARVRAFEQAGFDHDESERLAYPEFAPYNVVIVEPVDQELSADTTGQG